MKRQLKVGVYSKWSSKLTFSEFLAIILKRQLKVSVCSKLSNKLTY